MYRFTGGIPEWRSFNYPMTTSPKYKSIRVPRLSPARVAKLVQAEETIVLDVRPANFSRNNFFLDKTIHIPLLTLQEEVGRLPLKRPIIITDWAMKQSPIAAKFLISENYQVLGVLKGGIERWRQEGRPAIALPADATKKSKPGDFR